MQLVSVRVHLKGDSAFDIVIAASLPVNRFTFVLGAKLLLIIETDKGLMRVLALVVER